MTIGIRVGTGFDLHRLQHGGPLKLAGISIPFAKELIGHSDADVVAHAVIDALLGAAAMGDIGMHFPSSDKSLKGADSMVMLEKIVAIIKEAGFEIGNVDVTIIAEMPKLVPFYGQMREKMASTLGIDAGVVSVKAKSAEGIGIIGEGGAVAAQAVVLLQKK
jgi:2-C-methyl-D-erythritol 2,4-cyclodiphosphate synthase